MKLFNIAALCGAIMAASFSVSPSTAATEIIEDGTFQNSIGTGFDTNPWSDWTAVGITTEAAPAIVGGNAAVIPVGGDLFQRFSALTAGDYLLSFYVQNASPNEASLVFHLQEAFGTPVATTFGLGLGKELRLDAWSDFTLLELAFTIDNPGFPVNELAFSNSYDAPLPPIENSINPPGTVIKIARVSLLQLTASAVPEPATWAMLLGGFATVGHQRRRFSRSPKLAA